METEFVSERNAAHLLVRCHGIQTQCSALIQDELGSKFVDCKGAGTVFEKIFSRCCV